MQKLISHKLVAAILIRRHPYIPLPSGSGNAKLVYALLSIVLLSIALLSIVLQVKVKMF